MKLGQYVAPPAMVSGDRLMPSANTDKPLIVLPTRFEEEFKTNHAPAGKPAVFCDVIDIMEDRILFNVLWMGAAVVDSFREYVDKDEALPVKFNYVAPKKGGNPYIGVEPLSGPEYDLANAWIDANEGRVERERAERGAAQKRDPVLVTTDAQDAAADAATSDDPTSGKPVVIGSEDKKKDIEAMMAQLKALKAEQA